MYSNVTTSTRINSSSVHTYILRLFYITFSNGLLTNNSTWCQNRGCICISSVRRTYGRIHSSFLHPAYIRTIILWTELFPKKRREDPRRDSSIYLRVQWCFHIPTRITRFLRIQCILQCFYTQSSKFSSRINSSTRILQEILQLQGSPMQAPSSNCSPCLQAFYTAE